MKVIIVMEDGDEFAEAEDLQSQLKSSLLDIDVETYVRYEG